MSSRSDRSITGSDLGAGLAATGEATGPSRGETLTSPTGGSISVGAQPRSGSLNTIGNATAAEQANIDTSVGRNYDMIEKRIAEITDESGEFLPGTEHQQKLIELELLNAGQAGEYEKLMARMRIEAGQAEAQRKAENLAQEAGEFDRKNAAHRRRHGVDALLITGGRR